MTLKVQYQDADGGYVQWTRAKDPNKPPDELIPNDAPTWTVLTDSEHDDDWTLAVGPVTAAADTPFPKRKSVQECTEANALGDMNKARKIATWATKATRHMMRKGAFNAVFPLTDENNTDEAPANFHDKDHAPGYLTGEVSPKYLYDIAEDMFMDLAVEKVWAGTIRRDIVATLPRDPLVQLLSRFYGTITAQGGVCSMISAVTAGMASMASYPIEYDAEHYTDLIIATHGADHSFVVISYGNSPWIVADPWVAEPYIIPLEENYFDEAGIKTYQHICFGKRFKTPFGIPLMQGPWKREALDSAAIEGLDLTKAMLTAAESNTNALVAPDDTVKHKGAYMKWNEKYQCWEPRNVKTSSGTNFHTNHVWQHQTNHGTYNGKDLTKWNAFRPDNPPLLKANTWGNSVQM